MITSIEKISGCKVKIRFEADAEAFEQGVQRAYLKLRGRVQIPGFRKGKAPRNLIEKMHGESFLHDEALEILFPEAYEQALQTHALRVVDRPHVEVEQMESGKPLIFFAEVFVYPEVTLGQYKGLKVPKLEHPVTEEDVEKQVQAAREKVSRILDIEDGPAEHGDIVTLDYTGEVDGNPFDGGAAEGAKLTIGEGRFIPGFEEQVIGMCAGEERVLQVTFPAEYHAEELAGKDAVFRVKALSVQRKELPEVDDDFARDISEFDTMDAYRADIRAKLEADAAERTKDAFENACVEAAVERAEVEIPEPMVEREMDDAVHRFASRLEMQGMHLSDYCRYTEQTPESLREQYRAGAMMRVKTELVLAAIAKEEGIEPTESDIEAEILRYAQRSGKTLEEVKEALGDDGNEHFAKVAEISLLMGLLTGSAIPTQEKREEVRDT